MKVAKNLSQANVYSYGQKFISKLLIVTIFLLDLPFAGLMQTAKAETINPGNWVTIPVKADPMMQGLNIPANAASQGMWSGVYNWPFNGLHMAVLPDGRVLTYGTDLVNGFNQDGRSFDVWDPTLGFGPSSHNSTFKADAPNSFCGTSTYLNDGNLLVTGGNSPTQSNIYSPSSNSRTTASYNLAEQRWYATMISLPDGRPLMLGGMRTYSEGMELNPDQAIASGLASMTPEVLETNGWRALFGATSRDAFGPDYLRTSYPRAWVAPNGLVFGVSSDKMWYLDPAGNGSMPYVGDYKRYGGANTVNAGSTNTAVMYAPGKILIAGGNGGQNEDGRPSSNQATVIDINSGTPILTEQPNMSGPRRLANSVVLANGQVVITGGTRRGNNSGADAVFAAEIWTPSSQNGSTGTWSTGRSAAIYRGYHSQTVLMPNGTILSEGGGSPGPVDNKNAEIYYPPYLFRNVGGTSELATRPVIKAISGLSYNNNAAMQMDMESADSISQLVLIGVSQGTHNFNTAQRRIPLTFSQESFRLTTTIPNSFLTPPGYYQVVALDAAGVPSLGTIIAIGQNQAPPAVPPNPYIPPDISEAINVPILNPGGTANYSVTAVSGITYSWNFGDGSPSTPFSANPSVSYTYALPGLYVVTLSARDSENIITNRTFLQAVATEKTANSPSNSTPITVETRAGTTPRIWVVNPDNDTVSVMDSVTNTVTSTINVGISPRTLAVAPDGRIWVADKESATISIISPTTLTIVQTITLPRASQPHGIAFAPAGGSAYVALEATGQLLKLNPSTGTQQGVVNIGSNPRHVSISADGTKVLVSRFITPPLPGESTATVNITSSSNVGGEVVVVNPTNMTITDTVILHHSDKGDSEIQGSGIPNYLAAAVISPDGSTAWVPSKQDNIKRGLLRNGRNLDFQNTVRAISSRIDMNTMTEDYAKRIDHDNSSLGSAVVYHPSGVYMFVALETSRQVAVVDAIGGNELFKIDVGRAPQGLAISEDGNTLYVHEFMDRSVSIFNLSPLTTQGLLRVNQNKVEFTIDVEKLPARVVLGKQLFYDAKDPRLSRDSYMSCASCHNDAGNDGRVWDLTGFGEGLRNTISLRGRAGNGHGFLHWSANFDEVQDFEKQIRDLAGGTGLMPNAQFNTGTVNQPLGSPKTGLSISLDDLASYLNSLSTFAQSPYRNVDGTLTTEASAGKLVFNNSCSSCHSGNKFSDSFNASTLKNIGTINSLSGQRLGAELTGIDVPTLRDVWATAPYLHNGSATTLSTAVLAHNNLNLNVDDLSNVVAYLLQIGSEETNSINVAPTVSLTAPTANAVFTQGTAIALSANAADDGGSVTQVQFFDGTTLIGTDTSAPYSMSLANPTVGAHSFTAVATDNIGATTTSAAVSVTVEAVSGALSARYVRLTALSEVNGNPWASAAEVNILGANGQPLSRTGWVATASSQETDWDNAVAANAIDGNVNTIWHTAYSSGNIPHPHRLILDMTSSQVVTALTYLRRNGTANGTIRTYEVHISNDGINWGTPIASGTMAPIAGQVSTISFPVISGPSNIAPTVSLTAPTANAVFTQGTAIALSANAADDDGSVTQVQFFDGTTLIGTDTSAPYSMSLANPTVGAHSFTAVATDNIGATTTSAAISVTVVAVPNVAPTVSLTAPTANAVFTQGTAIALSANAADDGGSVTQVQFFDGTTLIGTDTSAPYSMSLANPIVGAHSFTAVATDNIGATTTSAAISVTVVAVPNVAPTVSLTAPTANAVFTQGTAIALSANAADDGGSVTQVQFFDGTTLIGTDTSAPYSMSLANPTVGAHSFTAVATDNIGATTTSAAVSVTVEAVSGALSARYVRLTALSEVNGNPWASAAEVNILGANGQPLSRTGWVATASSQETDWDNAVAANAIDGNVNTIWHTAYSSGNIPHPHRLILDMTSSQVVTALTYLRRNGTANGTIRTYEVHISNDGINWGTPIASGTMAPIAGQVSTISFPVISGPSNIAPTVSLTAPTANAVFTQGTAIALSANAADDDGSVTQVQFFDGTTLIGTDTSAPYSMSLANPTVGAHSFTAVATDNIGATTTSAAISVTVVAVPNVAPTVSLTAPTANAVFTQGTAIALSANAADDGGSVTQVQFFDGTTLIGTDTSAPYSMSLANPIVGAHSFTAVATDNIGATTTSAAISVTVVAVPNVAPTVSLTAPTANAVFTQGTAIALSANAADDGGSVTQVQFFDGTTLIGTDTSAPYSMSLANPTVGAHSFTAVATDNIGATTTSAAVSVTVEAVSGALSARYVRLTALSEVNGNPWASAAEVNILGANGQPLSRTGWVATASSQETDWDNAVAANAIDGNVNTIWHTAYSSGNIPHPHRLILDMTSSQVVTALTYLRRNGTANGTIRTYEVHISNDGINWGTPIASGTMAPIAGQVSTINFIISN